MAARQFPAQLASFLAAVPTSIKRTDRRGDYRDPPEKSVLPSSRHDAIKPHEQGGGFRILSANSKATRSSSGDVAPSILSRVFRCWNEQRTTKRTMCWNSFLNSDTEEDNFLKGLIQGRALSSISKRISNHPTHASTAALRPALSLRVAEKNLSKFGPRHKRSMFWRW